MGPAVFLIVMIACIILLATIHNGTRPKPEAPINSTMKNVGTPVSARRVESYNEICALCRCKTDDLCKSCNTKVCYECAAELNNTKCPTCSLSHKKVCEHDWVQIHYHSLKGYSPIKVEKYMPDYFPPDWKTSFGIKGSELHLDGKPVRPTRDAKNVADHICVDCGVKSLKYTMAIADLVKNKIEEKRKKKLALEMIYKGKNDS
jgi:hypothetical protein